MTDPDRQAGLVSATLAQLYLAQGHDARARAVLDEVLARDPDNGHALLLRARLRQIAAASLELRFVAREGTLEAMGVGELELSWSVPRSLLDAHADARVDVVVGFAVGDDPSLRYTSVRCLDLVASRRLDAPTGPASAACALVLSAGPGRRRSLLEDPSRPPLRVLATAEALSW